MNNRLEEFLEKIRPIGLMCGVNEKEMEGLGRLLMREAAQAENRLEPSGETFVCRFKDIDYFCVDPISCNGKARSLEMEFSKMPHIWQQIEGLEITDDIAKLRPIVITKRKTDSFEYRGVLIAVVDYSDIKKYVINCSGSIGDDCFKNISLATVETLED